MADLALDGEPHEARELAELMAQARSGDLAAFEQILLRYQRQVFVTALRLLGRREDAQDAAQEVFLRLYRHLGRLEGRDPGPWLYRVTVNICRDQFRRRGRAPAALEDEPEPVSASAPEQEAAAGERKRILEWALGRLSEKERAAVVLRDLEGLATGEVARLLGSSETTVRSQISSARLKLRRFTERFRRARA